MAGRHGVCAAPTVALCVLALLTLGVVMVSSADMAVSPLGAETPAEPVTLASILTSQPARYMGLALLAFAVGWALPVTRLADRLATPAEPHLPRMSRVELWILAGATLALLAIVAAVYIPGLGKVVNGAHRWIEIAGNRAQPSEIAKWTVPALLAWWCARRAALMPSFLRGTAPAMLAVGLVAGLIILEDLGTGALIVAVAGITMLAGGTRVIHFAMFLPLVALGLVAAIVTSPYRVQRLLTFMDPFADPQGTGYHMLQSLTTIAGGGPFGRGLGHGLQKFGYLPEDTTDFLFAVICEELGIAGAAIVCALYALLIFTILGIALRQTRPALRLFTTAVLATIGLQAIINLFVVTGLGPTKGIALPLLSAGGTGWILTSFCLGLVAAADRSATLDLAGDAEADLDDPPAVAHPA